jgi:hypothetical protein
VPKLPKRPRDPNQLAKLIVDLASGAATEVEPSPPTAAQELARSGGLKGGGVARARALSPEQRRKIARKASDARWSRASARRYGISRTVVTVIEESEENQCAASN